MDWDCRCHCNADNWDIPEVQTDGYKIITQGFENHAYILIGTQGVLLHYTAKRILMCFVPWGPPMLSETKVVHCAVTQERYIPNIVTPLVHNKHLKKTSFMRKYTYVRKTVDIVTHSFDECRAL